MPFPLSRQLWSITGLLGCLLLCSSCLVRLPNGQVMHYGGNPPLDDAYYYAQEGDWKQAMDIWRWCVLHEDRNTAGKAAYNLAIVTDMFGYHDIAIDWAIKSGRDFKLLKGKLLYRKLINKKHKTQFASKYVQYRYAQKIPIDDWHEFPYRKL